jgi:hypothetical protein
VDEPAAVGPRPSAEEALCCDVFAVAHPAVMASSAAARARACDLRASIAAVGPPLDPARSPIALIRS